MTSWPCILGFTFDDETARQVDWMDVEELGASEFFDSIHSVHLSCRNIILSYHHISIFFNLSSVECYYVSVFRQSQHVSVLFYMAETPVDLAKPLVWNVWNLGIIDSIDSSRSEAESVPISEEKGGLQDCHCRMRHVSVCIEMHFGSV